jgi:hypothetical protein
MEFPQPLDQSNRFVQKWLKDAPIYAALGSLPARRKYANGRYVLEPPSSELILEATKCEKAVQDLLVPSAIGEDAHALQRGAQSETAADYGGCAGEDVLSADADTDEMVAEVHGLRAMTISGSGEAAASEQATQDMVYRRADRATSRCDQVAGRFDIAWDDAAHFLPVIARRQNSEELDPTFSPDEAGCSSFERSRAPVTRQASVYFFAPRKTVLTLSQSCCACGGDSSP